MSSSLLVPAIAHEGHGPLSALRASVDAVKRTWGEAIVRHLSFDAVANVLYTVGAIATVSVLWWLPSGSRAQTIAALVAVAYFTRVIVLFHLVDTVFNAALHHYATRGEGALGFGAEIRSPRPPRSR